MLSCDFWLFFWLVGPFKLSELFSQSVNVGHVGIFGYCGYHAAKAEVYAALAAVGGTAVENTTWSLGAL